MADGSSSGSGLPTAKRSIFLLPGVAAAFSSAVGLAAQPPSHTDGEVIGNGAAVGAPAVGGGGANTTAYDGYAGGGIPPPFSDFDAVPPPLSNDEMAAVVGMGDDGLTAGGDDAGGATVEPPETLMGQLLAAARNERYAPEILPYPSVADTAHATIISQKELIAQLDEADAADADGQPAFQLFRPQDLLRLEVQRLTYVFVDLLRIRARKIQRDAFSIEADAANFAEKFLSPNEFAVAMRTAALKRQALIDGGGHAVPAAARDGTLLAPPTAASDGFSQSSQSTTVDGRRLHREEGAAGLLAGSRHTLGGVVPPSLAAGRRATFAQALGEGAAVTVRFYNFAMESFTTSTAQMEAGVTFCAAFEHVRDLVIEGRAQLM